MANLSRRSVLAATAAGGAVAAATLARAASFGNPDEPPQGAINTQGNPASATDPGPAESPKPTLASPNPPN